MGTFLDIDFCDVSIFGAAVEEAIIGTEYEGVVMSDFAGFDVYFFYLYKEHPTASVCVSMWLRVTLF